ncbi:hypothetical protein INR77_10465 [Erythrobacter sp. SCSIO 43205]|uniref:hypothetical protein n=1 Tax=Erythrobacter sp. SCSIO 43205 TaxID=2779361 RepID=UPI001CA7D898|nr:hypothetical protein [Erythrobacter sp. SCSIO 43205]UAB77238.1 hypothetical protein INR77_10465 [Erythrobacter sp. SCSIO 43205]
MSDAFTRTIARFTPHFLIMFFVIAIGATVATNGPVIDNLFYGSWLLIAAALMTRLDVYLEARQ